MGKLALKRPITALKLVSAAILPEAREGEVLELQIHADSHNVSIRDMAAYLELVDHIYGRLDPKGYRSYAMRPREHVRINEIRPGSVLLTIPGIISGASPLVILFLCLKYLPAGAEKLAAAYNHYEQGRLARENRKQIRRGMEQDPSLATVPRERRNELAALITSLLKSDGELLVRAERYARESVIDIQIRVRR